MSSNESQQEIAKAEKKTRAAAAKKAAIKKVFSEKKLSLHLHHRSKLLNYLSSAETCYNYNS